MYLLCEQSVLCSILDSYVPFSATQLQKELSSRRIHEAPCGLTYARCVILCLVDSDTRCWFQGVAGICRDTLVVSNTNVALALGIGKGVEGGRLTGDRGAEGCESREQGTSRWKLHLGGCLEMDVRRGCCVMMRKSECVLIFQSAVRCGFNTSFILKTSRSFIMFLSLCSHKTVGFQGLHFPTATSAVGDASS